MAFREKYPFNPTNAIFTIISIGIINRSFDTIFVTDFVQLQIIGNDSVLSVDLDGDGSVHQMIQIATLQGFKTATDLDDLLASGNLIS